MEVVVNRAAHRAGHSAGIVPAAGGTRPLPPDPPTLFSVVPLSLLEAGAQSAQLRCVEEDAPCGNSGYK
jgi:hypothetical protein